MIQNLRIISACDILMHDQTGGIGFDSTRRYSRRLGIDPWLERIPDDYARPKAWAKVNIIAKHLRSCDQVLWIDADAVIIGDADVRKMLAPTTLNIAKDHNGINSGVMAWTHCDEAFAALKRMEESYEKFADHPWFEQAALMEFVDELNVTYQPKHVFNAYEDDRADDTLILHFPGMSNEERLPKMRAATDSIKP